MEQEDNELLTLELIHRYVELLDKYFGSVSYQTVIYKIGIGTFFYVIGVEISIIQSYKCFNKYS